MFLRSLIIAAFFLFTAFNSFAQNLPPNSQIQNLAKSTVGTASVANIAAVKQSDLADKSPQNKIDKTQLLDTGNNVASHTNDLVKTLLGINKPSSLMFDDEELANIDRAIDSLKNNQTFVPGQDKTNANKTLDATKKAEEDIENEKSYIYLASIIFYSPKDWAVWINNQKITSDSNKNNKELFVKEIYPDRAKIVWSIGITKWRILSHKKPDDTPPKVNAKNNVEIEFVLKPNQTFILGSSRITEGRAVGFITRDNSRNNNPNAKTATQTLNQTQTGQTQIGK